MISRNLTLVIGSLLLAHACSNAGTSGDPKTRRILPVEGEQDKKDDKKNLNARIDIGIGDIHEPLALPPQCSQTENAAYVLDLEGHFRLDGQTGEWQSLAPVARDSIEDARDGIDINATYIATNKNADSDDLVGFVETQSQDLADRLGNGQAVILEFGRVAIDATDNLAYHAERLYKLTGGHIYEFDKSSGWSETPISESQAAFVVQGNRLEWRIRKRELDNVISHDIWWVRTSSRQSGAVEDWRDSTAPTFFAHYYDDQVVTRVKRQVCLSQLGGQGRFSFQQLRLGDLATAMHPLIFGAVRIAFERLQKLVKLPVLPMRDIPILLSREKTRGTVVLLEESPIEAQHFGFIFKVDEDLEVAFRSGDYQSFFEGALRQTLDFILQWGYPEASSDLRLIVRESITDQVKLKNLGVTHWLAPLQAEISTFLRVGDDPLNIPLPDRWERQKSPFASDEERRNYVDLTKQKGISFAHLLSSVVSGEILARVWMQLDATNVADALEQMKSGLNDELEEQQDRRKLEAVWSGWMAGADYSGDYPIDALRDRDGDGLPNFYEKQIGSPMDIVDMDKDGWTDLAEIAFGTEFAGAISKPNLIISDGYFADWQELLPSSILTHATNQKPGCPAKSMIRAHAAIGSRSQLVVAASPGTDTSAAGDRVHWEVEIKTKRSRRHLLILGVTNTYELEVLDVAANKALMAKIRTPVPFARNAIEFMIDFSTLGLTDDFSIPGAAEIRLRSIIRKPESIICDKTAAFFPLISTVR